MQNQGGFNRMTTFCKSRFPKELKDKIDAAGVRSMLPQSLALSDNEFKIK